MNSPLEHSKLCLVEFQFSRMHVVTLFLAMLVAQHALVSAGSHNDPAACQRIIKYMLINACGATKREFHELPLFLPMSDEEIENRYRDMVLKHKIKSVAQDYNPDEDWLVDTMNAIDDPTINGKSYSKSRYQRLKRNIIGPGLHMKNYVKAIHHDRIGSLGFFDQHEVKEDKEDRSPPPGELKAKCCGGVMLCSMDDFRGFCG